MTKSQYNRERNLRRYPNGISDLPIKEWYCRRCKTMLDKHLFYFNPSDSRGIKNICKECEKWKSKMNRMSKNYPRVPDDTLVTCTGCKRTKTASEFSPCAHKTNGLLSQCLKCYNDRWKKRKKIYIEANTMEV